MTVHGGCCSDLAAGEDPHAFIPTARVLAAFEAANGSGALARQVIVRR
ncbi:hypothetical protein [Micromonospora yangpuensis]|nr:hypothetical protein [Micromonospora yangpuensis]GGL98399.1 hypothetical protein GCM10012279_14850 [Micromonospora yangpuensis]